MIADYSPIAKSGPPGHPRELSPPCAEEQPRAPRAPRKRSPPLPRRPPSYRPSPSDPAVETSRPRPRHRPTLPRQPHFSRTDRPSSPAPSPGSPPPPCIFFQAPQPRPPCAFFRLIPRDRSSRPYPRAVAPACGGTAPRAPPPAETIPPETGNEKARLPKHSEPGWKPIFLCRGNDLADRCRTSGPRKARPQKITACSAK